MKSNNILLKQGAGEFGGMVLSQQNGDTIVREYIKKNASDTPAQQRSRGLTKECGRLWLTLSPSQMEGFRQLGLQITKAEGRRKTLSNYQTFMRINKIVMGSLGGQPVLDAPALETPAGLPGVTLVATRGLGDLFTLSLVGGTAYNSPCAIKSAPFASAGVNYWAASSFTNLLTVPHILDGPAGTPITSEFVAKYGLPAVGQKICVKVQPMTATGFRGLKYTLTAIVSVPGVAASESGDTEGTDETPAAPLQAA